MGEPLNNGFLNAGFPFLGLRNPVRFGLGRLLFYASQPNLECPHSDSWFIRAAKTHMRFNAFQLSKARSQSSLDNTLKTSPP